jgi:hypothetical protein
VPRMDVTIGGLAATASLVEGPALVALHGA